MTVVPAMAVPLNTPTRARSAEPGAVLLYRYRLSAFGWVLNVLKNSCMGVPSALCTTMLQSMLLE